MLNEILKNERTFYFADYSKKRERRNSINDNRHEIEFAIKSFEGFKQGAEKRLERLCDLVVFSDYLTYKNKSVIFAEADESGSSANVIIKTDTIFAETRELLVFSLNFSKYADNMAVCSINDSVLIKFECEI